MRSWFAAATMLCAAQLISGGVAAAEQKSVVPAQRTREIASPVTDRFALRGIYFQPSVETDLRFDTDLGTLGTPLTAEDDLGMDDELNQGRMELMFRMRPRHRMRVDFFKVDRFGDVILDREIIFGDEVFNVPDRVQSTLDWRMLGFTYTFSPLRFQRFELGTGVGIWLLEAEARGEVPARFIREEVTQGGAAPSLALDAAWAISRRWALSLRAQYFRISRDDFAAKVADYHGDVQYRWHRNFAVGLGYTAIQIDMESSDEDDSGLFSLKANGPELFFRVSF